MIVDRRTRTITALGIAQTLAWASSYYLPAILASPIARDLGISTPTVFAAFSAALILSALIGPHAGRAIDLWGGRPVLMTTNLVFAAGLVLLANAHGVSGLFVAWLVLGVGMGSGLYEAAFSALVRLYGHDARGPITGVTLVAGFASTIGWPLSTWLEVHVGWRGACLAWAGLHLVVGLPLNLSLPRATPVIDRAAHEVAPSRDKPEAAGRGASWLLAYVFAATWFIATAMAAHLPQLMIAGGATVAIAVLVGALVGPAQVAARILEFSVLRKIHPLLSARLAALMHPIGATLLLTLGIPFATVFGVLHGAGNGILTIAKGTLPLAIFGPDGYGRRQGLLTVPARFAQALAPWVFGLCLGRWGVGALWLSGAVGISAFVALLAVRQQSSRATQFDE